MGAELYGFTADQAMSDGTLSHASKLAPPQPPQPAKFTPKGSRAAARGQG